MQKLTLAYYKYPSQTVRNPTSQSSSFFNTHSYTQKTTKSYPKKIRIILKKGVKLKKPYQTCSPSKVAEWDKTESEKLPKKNIKKLCH